MEDEEKVERLRAEVAKWRSLARKHEDKWREGKKLAAQVEKKLDEVFDLIEDWHGQWPSKTKEKSE